MMSPVGSATWIKSLNHHWKSSLNHRNSWNHHWIITKSPSNHPTPPVSASSPNTSFSASTAYPPHWWPQRPGASAGPSVPEQHPPDCFRLFHGEFTQNDLKCWISWWFHGDFWWGFLMGISPTRVISGWFHVRWGFNQQWWFDGDFRWGFHGDSWEMS